MRQFSHRAGKLSIVLVTISLHGAADAASVWTGNVSNLWSASGNWSPNDVPGDEPFEDAVINSGTPLLDDDFSLRSLTVTGGTLSGTPGKLLLVNNGTFDWSGGLIGSGAAILLSNSGGLWSNTVSNAGQLMLDFASITTDVSSVFNNTGTLTLSGITFPLRAGTSSGRIGVGVGATLEIIGTGYTFTAGSSLAGTGTVSIQSTATFQTTASVQNVDLSGTLAGGTLTTTGQVNWTGGNMNAGGETIIGATSVLEITGGVALSNRKLTNEGVVNWATSNNIVANAGASISNANLFTITGNADLVLPDLTSASFDNTGTLTKSSGGATSIGIAFDNSGTVIVSSGSLSINHGGTGVGAWIVAPGATLRFASGSNAPYTLAGASGIANSGTLINAGNLSAPASVLTGANLIMDPATAQELNVAGDLPISQISWNRGIISGVGTSVMAGGSFNSSWGIGGGRELHNSGTLNWNAGAWGFGSPNVISSFDNTTPATIRNQVAGIFNVNFSTSIGLEQRPDLLAIENAGVINVTGPSTLDVHAAFSNSGSVNLAAGATLRLLNGSVSSGTITGAAAADIVLGSSSLSTSTLHLFNSGARVNIGGDMVVEDSTLLLEDDAEIIASSVTLGGFLATLQGGGTISALLDASSGLIQPGVSPGDADTLDVTGDATLGPGTVLDFDLEVSGPHLVDQIDADGSLNVGDAFLAITLTGDANLISSAERFVVLRGDAGRIGQLNPGSFDLLGRVPVYQGFGVAGSFDIEYTGTEVALTHFLVPEPAGIGLLTLVPIISSRRRRLARLAAV